MIESWMISAGIAVAGTVGTYSVIKYKVDAGAESINTLKNEIKDYQQLNVKYREDTAVKINAAFKRIDDVANSVLVLERDTSNHLDLTKAEARFVPREELALHLRNIDSELTHINKNSEMMVGKLDDMTKALSQFMLRQINEDG